MCWGHSPSVNQDYKFDVGTFTLNGPLTMTNECPMTVQCVIQVTGTGLAATNKLRAQASADACGTGSAISGYTDATVDAIGASGSNDQFDMGTATAGVAGTGFHLCWAHDSTYLSRRALRS